jgi:hypothetical protein
VTRTDVVHQQIGLRLFPIIFISIDSRRLFTIISDYFRLQKTKRLYAIIASSPKRRLFHLLLYDYFNILSAYIIAIIAIILRLFELFYRKILFLLLYLRCIIAIFFPEPIIGIMRIILLLFELVFCLTTITIIFFQCYYMHHCFSNTLSSL